MTFQLPDATIKDFGDEFLVRCPRCEARAIVRAWGTGTGREVRLVCGSCGKAAAWKAASPRVLTTTDVSKYEEGVVCIGGPVDWYFHLPLWLQAPCCGETLWGL